MLGLYRWFWRIWCSDYKTSSLCPSRTRKQTSAPCKSWVSLFFAFTKRMNWQRGFLKDVISFHSYLITLFFYNYEYKRILKCSESFLRKSSFYPKFWMWQTQGHVKDIFRIWNCHNASKEVFWQKKYFQFEFLWVPSKSGKQNWKVPFFIFIIVKKTVCDYDVPQDRISAYH